MSIASPSLVRASLTLALGHGIAHLLPLLLGPWIARLYTPTEFAEYSLVWAVASNLAVVACARYEMALPMAAGAQSLRALLALCLRLLALMWALSALIGWLLLPRWPAMTLLPALVLGMGGVQLLAMLATREQRFGLLAMARVWQWGAAAVLQVAAGLARWGSWGLLLAPLAALGLALLWLVLPLRGRLRRLRRVTPLRLRAVALRFRDFPLLNTPHAFAGAAQDTLTLLLIGTLVGDVETGLWALAIRYLKAPATLIGGAVSTALYPKLTAAPDFLTAREAVRRCIRTLLLLSLPFAALLLLAGPALFAWAFGETWRGAGELARALAPYLALHFVAAPLAVVTLAWQAQAWALRLALGGQLLFLLALALGLKTGGLVGAGWAVSAAMLLYFGYYLLALWRWKP